MPPKTLPSLFGFAVSQGTGRIHRQRQACGMAGDSRGDPSFPWQRAKHPMRSPWAPTGIHSVTPSTHQQTSATQGCAAQEPSHHPNSRHEPRPHVPTPALSTHRAPGPQNTPRPIPGPAPVSLSSRKVTGSESRDKCPGEPRSVKINPLKGWIEGRTHPLHPGAK